MDDQVAEDRLSVSFDVTLRHVVLSEFANSPLFFISPWGGRELASRIRGRLRQGRYPAVVTIDGEGVTYASPAKTTTVAWDLWDKAHRRFGLWVLPLAAQPDTSIAIPIASIGPGDAERLERMFAEHGLLAKRHRTGA